MNAEHNTTDTVDGKIGKLYPRSSDALMRRRDGKLFSFFIYVNYHLNQ